MYISICAAPCGVINDDDNAINNSMFGFVNQLTESACNVFSVRYGGGSGELGELSVVGDQLKAMF